MRCSDPFWRLFLCVRIRVCGLRQRLLEISHVSRKLAAVSGNYFSEDRLYVYKRAVLMKEHIDEFINLLGLFQVGQMFGLRNFGCFDGRIAKCIFLDDLVDVRFLSAAKNVNTVVDLLQGWTDPAFGIIADHAGINGLG